MKRWSVFYVMLTVLMVCLVGCSKSEKDDSESKPSAQPGQARVIGDLARLLPDGTMGFLATSGGDNVKASYDKSTLAKIERDPQVRDFYQKFVQELLRFIRQEIVPEGGEGREIMDLTLRSVTLALHRPIIVGMIEKKTATRREMPVYGVAILHAGPRKAEIETIIKQIETKAGPEEILGIQFGDYTMHTPRDADDVMVYWGWVDDYFVFAQNDEEGLAIQNLRQPQEQDPPAVQALAKVHSGDDLLALHVDVAKLIQLGKSSMAKQGDAEDVKKMEAALESLGLHTIRTATGRLGFSGADMLAEGWLEVPQPFSGLLKCLQPVSLQQFDLVEERAFTASIINADLAGLYDTVMETIRGVAPPRDYQEVQEGLAEFEQEIGFKIRDGLLASLAGPAVVYSLPPDINATSGAFAVMLELKDAALMARSLDALEQFVSAQLDREMPIKGMLQISTAPLQNETLHVWTIPFLSLVQITPCWMIVDNQLAIVSNPAVARTALQHLKNPNRGANSIRRKPTFQQVAQNPPPSMMSFGYIETGVLLRQILSIGQRVWPLLTMAAKEGDLNLPAFLPTLDQIIAEMGPSSDVLWTESDGFYVKSQGPISGGAVGMGVGVVGMGAMFLMPSAFVARSRSLEVSTRTQTANIEAALDMFELDCGRYPTTSEGLMALVEKPENVVGWQGPYIKNSDQILDPWDRPYIYQFPGTHNTLGYDLICYGRDGKPGGSGPDVDIINGEWMY